MVELSVGMNEAGQRADKLLFKYLNAAPASFVYKMMRKKNIVLNGKKMTGKEILTVGDTISIWFSEETLGKFHTSYGQRNDVAVGGESEKKSDTAAGGESGRKSDAAAGGKKGGERNIAEGKESTRESGRGSLLRKPPAWFKEAVLYEDDHIILVNKPANVLSQRAEGDTLSMNEYLIAYLLDERKITARVLDTFHPAFCNRLDRNTTGILVGGKTLAALQELSELFRTRRIKKYYLAIVCGGGMEDADLRGYLRKDEKTNKVEILPEQADGSLSVEEDGKTNKVEILPEQADDSPGTEEYGKKYAPRDAFSGKNDEKNEKEAEKTAAVRKERRNQQKSSLSNKDEKKWERIETSFHVLKEFTLPCDGEAPRTFTLLKIHLITGKTHQIRAHLASIGHPIAGDAKYGRNKNKDRDAVAALRCFEHGQKDGTGMELQPKNGKENRDHTIQGQLLHSYELDFPEGMEGELSYLAGRTFVCKADFTKRHFALLDT